MNFLSISRSLFYSSSARNVYPTVILAEKFSKLNLSTSSRQQGENEKKYKRPVQPYMRFRSEFIAKNKQRNPDLKLPELNKLLSEEWSNLDHEIKEEYKKIYTEEMEEFKAPLRKMPRKPAGIYAMFVKENFAKVKSGNPSIKAPEVIQKLGEQWREVSEEQKQVLKKRFVEETKRYESDVVTFEDKMSEEDLDMLNHLAKDKMKKLHQQRLRLLNFPKKPGGPFLYFVNMEKENFPRGEDENMKEWLKRMGNKWRNMPDEEKEMYVFVKKRAMEKYMEDVEKWNMQHKV